MNFIIAPRDVVSPSAVFQHGYYNANQRNSTSGNDDGDDFCDEHELLKNDNQN